MDADAGRAYHLVVQLQHLGFAAQHQYQGAPDVANVQRLKFWFSTNTGALYIAFLLLLYIYSSALHAKNTWERNQWLATPL